MSTEIPRDQREVEDRMFLRAFDPENPELAEVCRFMDTEDMQGARTAGEG